ncbi:MAG: PilC/PilY family type IV pilus protein [Lysobacteraceae bacterium]
MNRSGLLNGLLVAILVAVAGGSAPAQAALYDIADTPLYVQAPVKPAFIMAVDDSGSMQWEILARNQDGELVWNTTDDSFFKDDGSLQSSGVTDYLELFPFPGRGTKRKAVPPTPNFGFARSHEFNPMYYNPFSEYRPWRKAEEPHWSDANPSAAIVDPRLSVSTNNPAFDLTSDVRSYGGGSSTTNDYDFYVANGMTLPIGTEYRENGSSCSGLAGSTNVWNTASSVQTASANCQHVAITYFPATFYLTDSSFPGYTATPLEITNASGGPRDTTLYRYEIKPGNMTATAYAKQIQNFANWFQYYRNRNLALVGSLTESLLDVSFMRVGIFRINNRVNVTMYDLEPYDVDSDGDIDVNPDKVSLYSVITAINGNSGTPNRYAVDHLGKQFRRTGTSDSLPIPTNPSLGGACQVNAGMLFTDGYSNGGTPYTTNYDSGMGSPFADSYGGTLADVAAKHYIQNIRPAVSAGKMRVPPACASATPDPRLDCRVDPHMNFYGVTLGALGIIYGVDLDATSDPFLHPPAWGADTDSNLGAVDAIWHGTVNTRGKFINAMNSQEITAAFRSVLQDIGEKARPAGGVAASGTRRESGFLVYVPEYASADWTGNVRAYELTASGALGTLSWDAASKLATVNPADRKIFASVPNGSSGYQLVPFTVSGLGGETAAQVKLGIDSDDIPDYGSDTFDPAARVIDYIRGDQTFEVANGGVLRDRESLIGDILGSQPDITMASTSGYINLPPADGGGASGTGSYGAYLEAKRSKTPVLFVGANDGMLHAFDGSNSASGGRELFSIIPNSVMSKLGELPKKSYSHRYFVDGSPIQSDVRFGGAWRTIVTVATGVGGRSVLAVDATDAASGFVSHDFLWEFTNANLGYTIGQPRPALLQNGEWSVLVPNGINGNDHKAHLFVLDAADGSIVSDIQLGTSGTLSKPNGLTSAVPVDTDFDAKADVIYAGDMYGQLWKLVVASSGGVSIGNGGVPLYAAKDGSGNAQYITGSITATVHHLSGQMVYFGTGKYLSTSDSAPGATPQVETFYGIWDNSATVSGRSALVEQRITSEIDTAEGRSRVITTNAVNWLTQKGWYIDLKVQGASSGYGEKFFGRPRVQLGRVLFTTFTPDGDVCNPGGTNRVYSLAALTGASNLGVGDCPDCGAVVIGSGSPAVSPPVVLTPPSSSCRPGIDAGCDLQYEDEDGNACTPGDAGCNAVSPAAGPGCVNDIGLVLSNGIRRIATLSCGRQSWRQMQ